jgi:hypothetical protein
MGKQKTPQRSDRHQGVIEVIIDAEGYNRFGGAEGNRTPDLLNAIQALSQLSYSPQDVAEKANGAIRPRQPRSFNGLT